MSTQVETRPRIWAVAGGKGGVGKTAVSSSIAVALARSGFTCVAVDADFGAANLHSMLGMLEPRRSLREFLGGQVGTLDEISCETEIPKLKLVSGSRARVDAANLDHPRRQKLLRHLRKLDADHVIIDLGAGSSFNVLDLFTSADLPLAVVTPEPTSIENTYHFIKAAWFRAMRPAAQRPEVREALRMVLGGPRRQGSLPPRFLIEAVSELDASAGAALQLTADRFTPALVVNRAMSGVELVLGENIAAGCDEALGARVRAMGGLAHDKAVPRAVDRRKPVLEIYPDSEFAHDIYSLTERMLASASLPLERTVTARPGRIRRALGLDPAGFKKHEEIRQLAELAGSD
jgi:flagellar biosynthesis protein FlhG